MCDPTVLEVMGTREIALRVQDFLGLFDKLYTHDGMSPTHSYDQHRAIIDEWYHGKELPFERENYTRYGGYLSGQMYGLSNMTNPCTGIFTICRYLRNYTKTDDTWIILSLVREKMSIPWFGGYDFRIRIHSARPAYTCKLEPTYAPPMFDFRAANIIVVAPDVVNHHEASMVSAQKRASLMGHLSPIKTSVSWDVNTLFNHELVSNYNYGRPTGPHYATILVEDIDAYHDLMKTYKPSKVIR